jgi:ParB family chromosome partitioning protein
MSVAEIALRFGQSERFVKGRLALGNVHPEILAAFERGDLTLEAVAAYTLNLDQEAQATFFREAGQWSRRNVHDIKSAMRGGGIRADGKLASFIGEEAYAAADGQIAEDLFGSDSQWISADLIERLKAEKIEQIKADALADGWSFFATTEELGLYGLYQARILEPAGDALTEEEYARMEELSEQLEGYDPESWQDDEMDKLAAEYEELDSKSGTYTEEQKKLAGVVFDENEFRWKVGVLRPGQEKKAGIAGSASSGAAAKEKDPLALTQPLRDLIGDTATAAFKTAAIADPHKTLALIAAMLEQHENRSGSRPSRLKVERIDMNYGAKPENKERTIKAAVTAYAKMTPEELVAAVAGVFASTLDLSEKWLTKDFDYSHGDKRDEARLEHLALFDAKPVGAFDPDAYFTACTKPMIDAAMREMTGHAAIKPKKADMAREAAEAARKSGWLPGALRLKGYKIKKVA